MFWLQLLTLDTTDIAPGLRLYGDVVEIFVEPG